MAYRGNLHCHSTVSDGKLEPEEVVAAYRERGYDWLVISDHFEAEYGWQVNDTRELAGDDFVTIPGAELSSGPWDARDTYWIVAAGLPTDFTRVDGETSLQAIARAHSLGAFNVLLHPGLNNLPLTPEPAGLDAIDAVEVHNDSSAVAAMPDRADAGWFLDGLLERGHRLLATAGDDAHFDHPRSGFGAWLEVFADELAPDALLRALKQGNYYSTQGPTLTRLEREGDRLLVDAPGAYAISPVGAGEHWLRVKTTFGESAAIDLDPFRGSYCRIVVVDDDGRRAWSNPIWV